MRLRGPILTTMLFLCSMVPAAMASPAGEFDRIRAQQAEIQTRLAVKDERYEALSAEQRAALSGRQSALLKLIEGKQGPAELGDAERRELADSLEWIRTTLAQAEDDRRVCEYRKTLGSNRKERVCMTARQQREQREAARQQLGARGICGDCKSN